MKTIYESSKKNQNAHVSLVKYRNLNNISHYHSDHELIYVNEGSTLVTVDETIFHLNKGMCMFIHSNDIHRIESNAATITTILKADSKYFKNIFTSKKLSSPILDEKLSAESMLNEIESELKAYTEHSGILIDCVASKFFVHMLRNQSTYTTVGISPHTRNTNEIYTKISQKIFSEYATLTFDEAAEYMHLSKPYFSKLFHRIFGMTFTHYLNTVKVVAAIEKIKNKEMNMTDIAINCGFNTIRSFNRIFKSFTGYPPNSLPENYVFLYSLTDTYGFDPTLNCTEILS